MIEINVEIPQREVIDSTVTINARPVITGVSASVDNNVGTPYVDVTPTGTETEFSFDLAFHNLKGDKGEQGIQGETGATGQDGQDGAAATITVGSTTTGQAGTNASVVNSGTSSAAVLDFTIPKGDKGDTGATGADGQDGFSPTATVTKSGSVSTFTVTDKNGTTSTQIHDGTGTVNSVNNVSPDSNGNVSLTIPTYSAFTGADSITGGTSGLVPAPSAGDEEKFLKGDGSWDTIPGGGGGTVDQTYDPTSQNAQSGVAIEGAGFLKNTATYAGAITIGDDATPATTNYATNIGKQSQATTLGNTAFGGYAKATGSESAYGYGATAIGHSSLASGSDSTALGGLASATQTNAIQIGQGTNSTANSLQVGSYQLLDTSTGLIPDARLNLKTINSTSIKGSGDITIQGGHTWTTTKPTTTSTASSTNPAVVIQNYKNGSSWYRVYSDKWCEQGGYEDRSATGYPDKVTTYFLKPYPNTNYTLLIGLKSTYTSSTTPVYLGANSVYYDSFTTSPLGSNCPKYWYACGYID